MTETMTGLQVPESFVSVTGSGSVRLHLPAFPGPVTRSDYRDDRCWEKNGQEVDPRMDRKWISHTQEVGPRWTGNGSLKGNREN